MRNRITVLVAMLFLVGRAAAADEAPLLAHAPTLSKTQIVFEYGGYLWSVAREGGEARQLTTGGHEKLPIFSPDGSWIAFTGEYDGNFDVFVVLAEGGEPRRLTWHPGPDIAEGWTPDGKKVLFCSSREAFADFDRLYTVSVEGGWPEVLPMWRGEDAWFSPDGTRIAYVPNLKWQTAFESAIMRSGCNAIRNACKLRRSISTPCRIRSASDRLS
jgi:tricorn protease